MGLSIYVHVPFCTSRCGYCAFYSGEPLAALAEYPRLVAAEARLRGGRQEAAGPARTVYFGGGTPALLGAAGVGHVLEALAATWGIAADAEITVEANPGSAAEFSALRAAGVNRLSLGVQVLDDRLLRGLGRRHSAADARRALRAAAAAGFQSLAVDLLAGLPDTTPERLAGGVVAAVDHGAAHLSLYGLEIHPGTPLAAAASAGRYRLPEPDAEEAQWGALVAAAADRGLELYEVSNCARAGFRSRHNRGYWRRQPCLGLGPGAHGFAPARGPWGTRRWNRADLAAYAAALGAGRRPPGGSERLTREQALLEALFLGLRCTDPIDPEALAARYHLPPEPLRSHLQELRTAGLLVPAAGGALRPAPAALRRADGLAVWLHERLVRAGSAP